MAVSQSRDGSSASWLGVGLCGGHAALADPRTGELSAFWRAHEGALTCLAACSEHLMVTGSQVCCSGCMDISCRELTLWRIGLRRSLQAKSHFQFLTVGRAPGHCCT